MGQFVIFSERDRSRRRALSTPENPIRQIHSHPPWLTN